MVMSKEIIIDKYFYQNDEKYIHKNVECFKIVLFLLDEQTNDECERQQLHSVVRKIQNTSHQNQGRPATLPFPSVLIKNLFSDKSCLPLAFVALPISIPFTSTSLVLVVYIPVSTRRRFNVVTTFLTSKQRCIKVKTTSCTCWGLTNIIRRSIFLYVRIYYEAYYYNGITLV